MVPEGLVLLTSIAFAVGVIRLGRKQVLVQELPAIEGLARVDVVCVDKTGTLTEGGMRLRDVALLDDDAAVDDVLAALAAWRSPTRHPNAAPRRSRRRTRTPGGWQRHRAVVPFSSRPQVDRGDASEGHGSWVLGAPDMLLPEATRPGRDGRR